MENNENFVAEAATENVEQTTEQTPKMFTQEEVNEIVGRSKARTRAKIEKEYQRKYGDLEGVLKAGTGKESVEEITDAFKQFYQQKGVPLPERPKYSDRDTELLAHADAEEIIHGGFEDVVEEADRLKELGVANMTAREKAVFVALTNHIKETENGRELSKIGVTAEVYGSKEFKDFAGKFAPSTPIADIYDIYRKTQPTKEIKSMGSMKSDTPPDNGLKDFYSYEEAVKFTKEDFDKNPALYQRVQESMRKWK